MAQPKFVRDFVAAWDKVMNLDRFELGRFAAARPANTESDVETRATPRDSPSGNVAAER